MRGSLLPPMALLFAFLCPAAAQAETAAAQLYRQAISLCAQEKCAKAVAQLEGALTVLSAGDPWHARMAAAAALLRMREERSPQVRLPAASPQGVLVRDYMARHPAPVGKQPHLTALLAALLPGLGHARLGRWHDAFMSALLVWPMLLLTVWAARRRLGPVTVFFAGITAWLWSGTVFSAMSLTWRGDVEAYLSWWQGLWQASGLPGRPW